MIPGRRSWLAAVAILLAGCSSSSIGPNEPPSTLTAYYAQHLDWQPCDNGFQCARLLVPFDYAHPGGQRFSLPVIKLPATDPGHRVGPLVINPGGPGGSGRAVRARGAQRVPARRCWPGSTSSASTRAAWPAASPRWPA